MKFSDTVGFVTSDRQAVRQTERPDRKIRQTQTDRQADKQVDRQADRQKNRLTDRPEDRQADKQTDRQIERKTDSQTERQTTSVEKTTQTYNKKQSFSTTVFELASSAKNDAHCSLHWERGWDAS